MFDQTCLLGEAFLTHDAAVGLLSSVHPLVGSQVVYLRKGLTADSAEVRLVSGVHSLMKGQLGCPGEALAADAADVKPLVTVDPLVGGKVRRLQEAFRTESARVRLHHGGMNFLMDDKVGCTPKALVTDTAQKQLATTSMFFLMDAPAILPVVCLGTYSAGIRLCAGMLSLVSKQAGLLGKLLLAHTADVGRVASANILGLALWWAESAAGMGLPSTANLLVAFD